MALRFGGGTAPGGEGSDAQDADGPAQGQGDDLSGAHFAGAFDDALAVDANMALLDQRLRRGAAFDEPDAMQEAIDPHGVSEDVLTLSVSKGPARRFDRLSVSALEAGHPFFNPAKAAKALPGRAGSARWCGR